MNKIFNIVITGAESTGKTELTEKLARHYQTIWVPEYAREYIQKINFKYGYEDVVRIAKKQMELIDVSSGKANRFLFIDTYLVIIKIWFKWVFKKYPGWIDGSLEKDNIDLYLLCNNDIPWYPDKARENPGENRDRLYNEYLNELNRLKKNFAMITGTGKKRFFNAVDAIEQFLE